MTNFKVALKALSDAGVAFVVVGAYAGVFKVRPKSRKTLTSAIRGPQKT